MRPSGSTAPRWTLVTCAASVRDWRTTVIRELHHSNLARGIGATAPVVCSIYSNPTSPVEIGHLKVMWVMPRSQRTRSARAIANDAAIRDAAISEVLRVGVDHVSLRDVGHEAGLTHGATYARYEDVDELLVDLWNSTLVQRAVTMYELCRTAASEPSANSVGAVFQFLRDASAADVAAVHVLLVARRIPILQEEVEPFIQAYLEG